MAYKYTPAAFYRNTPSGRGLTHGGIYDATNVIDYCLIISTANATDFGDMAGGNIFGRGGCGGTSIGIIAGGSGPIATSDYITYKTTGNSATWGNLTVAKTYTKSCAANHLRLILPPGETSGGAASNVIDYFNPYYKGNATDFGDAVSARKMSNGTVSDTTRCVLFGYYDSAAGNQIDYWTIMTTGNASDFGDQTNASYDGPSCGSNAYGIAYTATASPPAQSTSVITIQTTGNASSYGNMSVHKASGCAYSNTIRGVFIAGYANSAEYTTIASSGTWSTYGTMTVSTASRGGQSDCHGGINV